MQDPRQRRAQWITRKGRLGDQDEVDFDLLYWERIPPEQRMAFVWQLSLEQWRMIDPDVEARSGLYRSIARVVRP